MFLTSYDSSLASLSQRGFLFALFFALFLFLIA